MNDVNIIVESKDFIKQTRVESGSFKKAVDRDGIRKEMDNAVDMINVLSNDIGSPEDKQYLIEKLKISVGALKPLFEKRNYQRVGADSGPIYNEDINTASMSRVNKYLELISDELGKFSYTVSIPDQPRLLKELEGDVSGLLNTIDGDINAANSNPIDQKWIDSGVYGKMNKLNTVLFFKIGDTQSTASKPQLKDITSTMDMLINDSNKNGVKVFSNSTDYKVFVQRSFSEIENVINNWGGLDPDIGLKVTFIIIGDGKNDPEGKYENVTEYDKNLLNDMKDIFDLKKVVQQPGMAALSAINTVNVRFCVPQKRYNTDILDSWSKLLQAGPNGGGPAVYYYMFESLKDNGRFTPESTKKLLD